jgi:hypothetical protein
MSGACCRAVADGFSMSWWLLLVLALLLLDGTGAFSGIQRS